jgi:two-component system CheB/CheR fusion protein
VAARGAAFPIVGIGASAGGLEALEQFLHAAPENGGLAVVIVQHLDPTHKGIMVELLQRSCKLPVCEISDGLRVEPDHVYLIPPGRDLSILNGVLHLLEPAAPRGLRLPIDFFFRALADDWRQHAVGVILSGMGADGTLGLRAIKANAGAVFVQEPASAKFDAMPRSAIDAGLADVVAPAAELPVRILAYLHHLPRTPSASRPGPAQGETDTRALDKVLLLLRTQTGHDFSLYKKSTLLRRVERRMGLHQLTQVSDYVRYMREYPDEADHVFKELRIGGDEFAILLPQTDAAAASAAMQRLREVLQQHNANHPGNPVGLSIGIGTSEPGEPLSRVLARADADMYRDKRGASR